jgi:hypothetical protein
MEGIFNILLKNCGLGRNKKYHISVIMTRMKRGIHHPGWNIDQII